MANSDRYTPKERAISALERRPPVPGLVPTFELEFQLGEELLGKDFYRGAEVWGPATASKRERMIRHEFSGSYRAKIHAFATASGISLHLE